MTDPVQSKPRLLRRPRFSRQPAGVFVLVGPESDENVVAILPYQKHLLFVPNPPRQ